MSNAWEPSYGFCATNETDRVALAMTLEALRRRVCAYGGGDRCDCKYGLSVDPDMAMPEFGFGAADNGVRGYRYDFNTKTQVPTIIGLGSEQTGCPELRELIHRLLHRDQPLI